MANTLSNRPTAKRPWRLSRRWLLALVFAAPCIYAGSYPVAYRMLVGSDEAWKNGRSPRSLVCFSGCLEPVSEIAVQRSQTFASLEEWYYPPAIWMTDHTWLGRPMFAWAKLWSVSEQLEFDQVIRLPIPDERLTYPSAEEWIERTARRASRSETDTIPQ